MLLKDYCIEVVSYYKCRTKSVVLSSVGIAWGMFIMVALIGMGNGLEKGVNKLLSVFSNGTVYVYGGEISIPTKGFDIGAKVLFTDRDVKILMRIFEQIEYLSPVQQTLNMATYADKSEYCDVKGVNDEFFNIKEIDANEGRVLNFRDLDFCRKVAVIGSNVETVLFGTSSAIGKYITVNNVPCLVVGVISNSLSNMDDARTIYLPFSVYCQIFSTSKDFSSFVFSTKVGGAKISQQEIQKKISHICGFSPVDNKAMYVNVMEEQVQTITSLFSGINMFLLFICVSTMIGGVLGISNVMYASVKERTHEIGLRKAVGAKNRQIGKMILTETVVITIMAELVGIICAYLLLSIIGVILRKMDFFFSPSIDIVTTLVSVVVLGVSSIMSGIRPAMYAASIPPIDALSEKI